ncbi:hypothetical protein BH10CHL1_BH10CHL1_40600 [soil metagenome]
MLHKTIRLLLILALMLGGTASVFAQDTAPTAPHDENATRSLYLPLVQAGGQTAAPEATPLDEADLTDTMDAVEAASSGDTGPVFVTTNAIDDVRGNEIVMYSRAPAGALTLTGRFPTGGQGLGSGLGSQGALMLSNNGHWLFAVNAGSNEISVFSVHQTGLLLTDKVASGGVRPISLTVRKNLVYVLNAGDPGNITGFKLHENGTLTPLADSTRPLSNNNTGAAPGPAQVSFTPDGDALVVTEKGTNLIDIYQVHKNGLTTGPMTHASSGMTPFGFAFADDTLIVSEAFGGVADASAASSYAVGKEQFKLLSASIPTGQTAACWVVVTKDGRYAYTTNAGSASVSGYQVDKAGRLTLLNSRAGVTGDGTGPADVAMSHRSRLLYVLSPRSQTVIGFAVQTDGSLISVGSFGGLGAGAAGIAAW